MVEIKGMQKTSLIDWPDRVSCVVFLAGCNFRCPYCQNRSLVEGHESLPTLPEDGLFAFLEKRKNVLDGVVVTGGEPTLWNDLPDFIARIKRMGLAVKLDTNGSNPEMLEMLLRRKLVDYVAMDVKAPFAKYASATNAKPDTGKVRRSVRAIRESGVDYEFRTTVTPRLHTEDDVMAMGNELSGSKKYVLQQFRPLSTLDPSYKDEKPYTAEKMKAMAKRLERHFGTVEVRT